MLFQVYSATGKLERLIFILFYLHIYLADLQEIDGGTNTWGKLLTRPASGD